MKDSLKALVRKFKAHQYVVFVAVLAMGVFNAVTIYSPIIQQSQREDRIVESFNKWWEEEGAPQFIAVGLNADEKTRAEEFEQFRDRYLQQNHTYIVEDRIAEMRQEFRKWWEIGGGKDEYVRDHKVYPNERIFEQECYKWIKKYTDKHARYAMAFIPKDEEYERMFTSWILTPGMFSYAIFAIFFLFAYTQLSRRWGVAVTLGCFAGAIVVGSVGVILCTSTTFFDHFVSDRYMGASAALAFMLGATSFGLTKDSVPGSVRAAAILGAVIDILTNVLLYGGIYGAVALTSLAMFALGAVAGLKIPNRKISHEERKANALEERIRKTASNNPVAMRKAKTRALIKDGLQEANEARYEKAQQILTQAMSSLLQEYPIDTATAKDLTERMVHPNMYISVPSVQWLEWGETAKGKNSPEIALMLLEKGLSTEKNEKLARRALFNIGEIRVAKKLDREEGLRRLKQVLDLGDNDALAIQAKRLIEFASKSK
jgi:ABC-type multidrug transport system fused ATPase/permease subunit